MIQGRTGDRMKPIIFISAVSEEFRGLRREVADVLRKLGYEPHSQESLPTLEGDLRQALREQIDHCEGLIQIVGAGYGAEPPSIDADYGRVSYTQFEYLYARLKGKKRWVFFAADGDAVGRDKPIAHLDLPRAELGHPDPAAYQAERRALQQRYVADLRSNGQVRHSFADAQRLLGQVQDIRDELLVLRTEWERARRRIGRIQFGVGVLLVIVLLALLAAYLTGDLERYGCRVPVMHGTCRVHGLGGVPTPGDEQRWFAAVADGCPGLRDYTHDPKAHPVFIDKARAALASPTVQRSERWQRKDNLVHSITIGIGTSPSMDSEEAARAGALQQAITRAEQLCLMPTAGEDFRLPSGADAAQLREVVMNCERVRDQYHCEVNAQAHCQLERRSYHVTETCHVSN